MSQYSTLQCDGGCGAIITERGYVRVELPDGWSRSLYEPADYCPACTLARMTVTVYLGERGNSEG